MAVAGETVPVPQRICGTQTEAVSAPWMGGALSCVAHIQTRDSRPTNAANRPHWDVAVARWSKVLSMGQSAEPPYA